MRLPAVLFYSAFNGRRNWFRIGNFDFVNTEGIGTRVDFSAFETAARFVAKGSAASDKEFV